jgi:hypothetical protein
MQITDQGWTAIGVCTGLYLLASIAVGLRFLARKKRNMEYGADDWTTLLGLVSSPLYALSFDAFGLFIIRILLMGVLEYRYSYRACMPLG